MLFSYPTSRKRQKYRIEPRRRVSEGKNKFGAKNLKRISSIKRKRDPNRSAEVIAEEKKLKAMRKLPRDQSAIDYVTINEIKVNLVRLNDKKGRY